MNGKSVLTFLFHFSSVEQYRKIALVTLQGLVESVNKQTGANSCSVDELYRLTLQTAR